MSVKQKALPLPLIPDKRYFTISEAAQLCQVEPYVLRYWEQEFSQIKPTKRNGRRFYQRADIERIRGIRELLYDKGFTIKGARAQLNTKPVVQNENGQQRIKTDKAVKRILMDLEQLLDRLRESV